THLADPVPRPGVASSSGHRTSAVEKREAYKERWIEQEARRATGELVWKLYDNQAYNLSARPELSIVITLFNYAHYIQECVISISRAAKRVSHGVEIVIVNDASTDDSITQAIQCQTGSSLPKRIVDKRFNT